jgi:hypothetical protein
MWKVPLFFMVVMGMAFPCGSHGAEFICNDVAGGKVICLLERGDSLTKISCKRGTLFETKWVCSTFPETERALCRSKGGERIFQLTEFEDDSNICTSMCYCPDK